MGRRESKPLKPACPETTTLRTFSSYLPALDTRPRRLSSQSSWTRQMKRFIGSASAHALCFIIAFSGSVSAKSGDAELSDHRPSLRLAKPHWPPLNEQQIKDKISGRSVIIDETYETLPGKKLPIIRIGGCPPRETFFQDGRWQIGICERAYRVYTGRWSIETLKGREWLCIEGDQHPTSCRLVWQGPTDDLIFMALGAAPTEDQLNDDFMPYRVSVSANRALE